MFGSKKSTLAIVVACAFLVSSSLGDRRRGDVGSKNIRGKPSRQQNQRYLDGHDWDSSDFEYMTAPPETYKSTKASSGSKDEPIAKYRDSYTGMVHGDKSGKGGKGKGGGSYEDDDDYYMSSSKKSGKGGKGKGSSSSSSKKSGKKSSSGDYATHPPGMYNP